MQRICGSLAAAGYNVQLVGWQRPASPPLTPQPYRQHRLRGWFQHGKLFYLEYNLRLFFYLLRQRAAAWCACDLDTALPVWLRARLGGQPLVYDAHELFTEVPEVVARPSVQRIWRWVEAFVVPRARLAYTVGPALARVFEQRYGRRFGVVRNVSRLHPERAGAAALKSNENWPTADQLLPTTGEFIATPGRVSTTPGQLTSIAGELSVNQGQLTATVGQTRSTPDRIIETQVQLAGTPGQFTGIPGQLAGTPGQPAGTPGQRAGTPGQRAGTPGQLASTPGQLDATAAPRAPLPGQPHGYILYQGALNVGRGLEALLDAMPQVAGRLVVCGEGDLSAALRARAGRLGLLAPSAAYPMGQVEFRGFVLPEQLRDVTRQAGVGIMLLENIGLSYYYSLANKFFDYVQAGVPQVCIDFPEYRALNEECEVAELVADLGPATLAAALNRLLRDEPARYQHLAENCARASPQLSWQHEERVLLQLWSEVVPVAEPPK